MKSIILKLKRVVTIEGLVELILVVFAVGNYSTTTDYFLASGMNALTSHAVGVLMGLILIASALMLSRVEQSSKEFQFILISTMLGATLAAILQSLAYYKITDELITSIIKGAGFPIVEVALAYSVSLFTSYQRAKELQDADKAFDEQLANLQRDVMRNIDPEKLRESVEAKMHRVVDARIDKFVADQLAKYQIAKPDAMQPLAKPPVQNANENAGSEDAIALHSEPIANGVLHPMQTMVYSNGATPNHTQDFAPNANAWTEEQLAYFATEPNYANDKDRANAMNDSGLFTRKEIALYFDKSESTISRWLNK